MPMLYYKILDKKVAHEIIDGEAIIIDFDTGNYYSLNGIAADIWQWVASGASRQQIIDAFREIQPDQIQGLDAFFDQLVKEQILEKSEGNSETNPLAVVPTGEIPFHLPALEKYNDMQALLLSDPIHEVDETGWPRPLSPG